MCEFFIGGVAKLVTAPHLHCGYFESSSLFASTQNCEYSTMVSATAFQAEDVGSIPITRSK